MKPITKIITLITVTVVLFLVNTGYAVPIEEEADVYRSSQGVTYYILGTSEWEYPLIRSLKKMGFTPSGTAPKGFDPYPNDHCALILRYKVTNSHFAHWSNISCGIGGFGSSTAFPVDSNEYYLENMLRYIKEMEQRTTKK